MTTSDQIEWGLRYLKRRHEGVVTEPHAAEPPEFELNLDMESRPFAWSGLWSEAARAAAGEDGRITWLTRNGVRVAAVVPTARLGHGGVTNEQRATRRRAACLAIDALRRLL